MIAIIINSGLGKRMGDLTLTRHKSMVEISPHYTLIENQIDRLLAVNVKKIIITTGHHRALLEQFIQERYGDKAELSFYYSPEFATTNYIYSLSLIKEEFKEDVLLMHGDLYFGSDVLQQLIDFKGNGVVVDSSLPLPEKDFKGRIKDDLVIKIAIDVFGKDCLALQPLYKMDGPSFTKWKAAIDQYCATVSTQVYAEVPLNALLEAGTIRLKKVEINGKICSEVDTLDDLRQLQKIIKELS